MSEASHANSLYCQIVDLQKQLAASQTELANAKFAIAALEAGIAGAAKREAVLREFLTVYAAKSNWWRCSPSYDAPDNLWLQDSNGYDPAQAALAKVEGMK